MNITNIRVVAEVITDDGPVLVDCAIRERDLSYDVVRFLLEKARGDHGPIGESAADPEFEYNDSLGG